MRKVCAFILFSLSALLFFSLWTKLGGLWHSAWSFKLHHEVASILCMDLIRPILALAAFAAGVRCLGKNDALNIEDGAVSGLVCLVPILVACAMLFENEVFFSMFDPKGFPVHPPEIIAHPLGGWVTPRAHALAAFALMVSFGLTFFALRDRKRPGESKK